MAPSSRVSLLVDVFFKRSFLRVLLRPCARSLLSRCSIMRISAEGNNWLIGGPERSGEFSVAVYGRGREFGIWSDNVVSRPCFFAILNFNIMYIKIFTRANIMSLNPHF